MLVIYQKIGSTQAFISKLPENGVKLLNWLIDQMRSKPSIKVSIEFICKSTGIAESTLHRWLAKFNKWGLIFKRQKYGMYCHNTITLNPSIVKEGKNVCFVKYPARKI